MVTNMKKALIDPNVLVYSGEWILDPKDSSKYIWNPVPIENSQRVCQVESTENIFDIAAPLYWQDCSDEIIADQWYFNGTEFVQVPSVPDKPTQS